MRLKQGQRCPLHRSTTCCGRGPVVRKVHEIKYRQLSDGTKVYPNGREVCPPAVLRKRKDVLIASQETPTCKACGEPFVEYDEIELGHLESKGSGGHKREDRFFNLCLLHKSANREQGSRPFDAWMKIRKPGPCEEVRMRLAGAGGR